MMARMGDQKGIMEQINSKKAANNKKGGQSSSKDKQSIAEFFKEAINKKWYRDI